jgi:hypothetical protein
MFTNHLAIRPREGHQIDLFQYSGQVSDVDYTFFPFKKSFQAALKSLPAIHALFEKKVKRPH